MRKQARDNGIKINRACARDIESVLKIDAGGYSETRLRKIAKAELSNRFSHFYVARHSGLREIVGYIIYWIIEDLLEIHHFAIKEEFRGTGIGTAILEFILDDARAKKVKNIFLEVRESNSKAIRFYRKIGFKKSGSRKEYYRQPVEDALIFSLELDDGVQLR